MVYCVLVRVTCIGELTVSAQCSSIYIKPTFFGSFLQFRQKLFKSKNTSTFDILWYVKNCFEMEYDVFDDVNIYIYIKIDVNISHEVRIS